MSLHQKYYYHSVVSRFTGGREPSPMPRQISSVSYTIIPARFVTVIRSRFPPPRGGGPSETKTWPKTSKITKYCPNPIMIINNVVGDVPRSVRHVSEHVSDDLLWSWGHFLKTIFGGSARPKRDPHPLGGGGGHRDRLTVTNLRRKTTKQYNFPKELLVTFPIWTILWIIKL